MRDSVASQKQGFARWVLERTPPMRIVANSFLFLVVRPGAPSSVLAPSSELLGVKKWWLFDPKVIWTVAFRFKGVSSHSQVYLLGFTGAPQPISRTPVSWTSTKCTAPGPSGKKQSSRKAKPWPPTQKSLQPTSDGLQPNSIFKVVLS